MNRPGARAARVRAAFERAPFRQAIAGRARSSVDRASRFEREGREFESLPARHFQLTMPQLQVLVRDWSFPSCNELRNRLVNRRPI
jgi:hypothetical protein